jgi:IclR family transcriptional regulator, positive regulator for flagellar biogenesis
MPQQATMRVRADGTPRALTQTVARGLELLRAFRCEARPLSNRTIAERTGLPKATVSRITKTLVNLGYLTRIPSTGYYQVGAGVVGIGSAYLANCAVARAARPFMEGFASRHEVSLGLGVPDRLQIMYLIWCRSPKTLTLRLTAGSTLPMARTAIGKAYLWALPAAERRELLARLKRESEERWSTVLDGINRAFADLDRDGFCIAIAELQRDTFGIAVPLVLDDGRTILALGGGAAKLDVSEALLRKTVGPDLIATAALVRDAISHAGGLDS